MADDIEKEQVSTRPNGSIYLAARQFHDAAELLFESAGYHPNGYLLPLLVNYSLCAELCLKSLEGLAEPKSASPEALVAAARARSGSRANALAGIYAGLARPSQDAIRSEFKAVTGKQLEPLLETCAQYFMRARTPYEPIAGPYDLNPLRELARGLMLALQRHSAKQVPPKPLEHAMPHDAERGHEWPHPTQ